MSTKSYFYAYGKRKSAIATIRLYTQGAGDVSINEKPLSEWVDTQEMREAILRPLDVLGIKKDYDISIKVENGGKMGQAQAISLGIARALIKQNPDFRTQLKNEQLLTRDARVKERKKPGLKRARKSSQWSKR